MAARLLFTAPSTVHINCNLRKQCLSLTLFSFILFHNLCAATHVPWADVGVLTFHLSAAGILWLEAAAPFLPPRPHRSSVFTHVPLCLALLGCCGQALTLAQQAPHPWTRPLNLFPPCLVWFGFETGSFPDMKLSKQARVGRLGLPVSTRIGIPTVLHHSCMSCKVRALLTEPLPQLQSVHTLSWSSFNLSASQPCWRWHKLKNLTAP